MRLSYRSRLLLNFAALFAAFTLVLVVFQQRREHRYRKELLEARLRTYSDLVAADAAAFRPGADSTRQARRLRILPPDLRLTVIDRSGAVTYESDGASPAGMDNHENRPEVKEAAARREGCDIRRSATTGTEFFYYAKNYGSFTVRVALPYDDSVRHFMQTDNIFLWFVLLLFCVALAVIVHISDNFGKAVSSLRRFIDSAERGLVDYNHLHFPRSELGDIGRAIMEKYQQIEESNRRTAAERERLIRHFHCFEEGIAFFNPAREKIYANPRFMQYVNTALERPTADIRLIWESEAFAPAREFLALNAEGRTPTEEAPVFRFTIEAGSTILAVQLLIYADDSFEMTLADITRAEKARLLKQQMSNNITHELRTPVSSIRGYLETLINCPSLPQPRRDYFMDRAYLQTLRLADLIRDVAMITKAEEAPETLVREQIDLSALVADVAEELRPKREAEEMTFSHNLPADLRLVGNYSLVYAVFRNLMENSIRYAGRGTAMRLECDRMDRDFCFFRFYDTGGGVPEEHLPRLFERFYRVSEGRTRDGGGTGLGLSIVRNAVQLHGGTISVRNRREGGLEFLFSLTKGFVRTPSES